MKKQNTLLLICALFLFFISSCFAAQDTTILKDNAPIRLEPRSNSKILEYLQMGVEIRVSSYPMQGGWYKTRSKTGVYGWIHESFISVFKPKSKLEAKSPEETIPKPERDRKWMLRGLMGFDFFRPDDLNSLFDFTDLNTGYTMGGEFGVFVSERMAAMLRIETIVKDLVARERLSGIQYNLAIRSYPIMGGLDFYIAKLPAMRLSFGIFGGVAMATSFASEAMGQTKPNVMVIQRSPFTTLARLNLTRPLGRVVSVFIEGGYRYLRTDEIDPSSAFSITGGSQIYAQGGVFRTRTIDLSGVELALGLGLHF